MRAAIVIALATSLAACKPGGAITCPTIRGYSAAFQAAAARELDTIDKTAPHLAQMISDYGVERDAIRECIKRRK